MGKVVGTTISPSTGIRVYLEDWPDEIQLTPGNDSRLMTLAPNSVPEKAAACPYPGCGRTLTGCASRFCGCEYQEPMVLCASCGVISPGSARYCRGCRSPLPPAEWPDCRTLAGTPSAGFLFVPGVFHAPPVAHRGHLWCLAEGGQVSRLSLGPNAKPRDWARIESPAAGFNRFGIAEAPLRKSTERRPMLLAADPVGIWSLPLVQHQASLLYAPPTGREIVANQSATESVLLRGVSVSSDAYAFLMRAPGADTATLTIRNFDEERAGEQPIEIGGSSFLGPVMENGLVAVCSDEEVAVWRVAEQAKELYEFKNFAPLFTRAAADVVLPLGVVPLWAGSGDRGFEARIAGIREGRIGWLRVFFDRHYEEFVPLPRGACISRAAPEGVCVNLLNTIEFLGTNQRPRPYGMLEPGLPVGCDGTNLAYFNRADSPARHSLTVIAGEVGGLQFEDRDCHANSCCGIGFAGASLVVSYIVPSKPKSERGLRIAHWRLRE